MMQGLSCNKTTFYHSYNYGPSPCLLSYYLDMSKTLLFSGPSPYCFYDLSFFPLYSQASAPGPLSQHLYSCTCPYSLLSQTSAPVLSVSTCRVVSVLLFSGLIPCLILSVHAGSTCILPFPYSQAPMASSCTLLPALTLYFHILAHCSLSSTLV